ncbi:putative reverse transcriptase domain-containing protein [Tanacetum coccineum]
MISGRRASRFKAMANETEKNDASGSAVIDENRGRDDARQHPKKRGTSKDVVASLDKRVAGVETSMAELKTKVEGLEGLDSDFTSIREDFRVALNTLSGYLMHEIRGIRDMFMDEIAKIRKEFGEEVSTLHQTIEDLQADVALCKWSLASGGGNTNYRPKLDVPKPSLFVEKREARAVDDFLWEMEHTWKVRRYGDIKRGTATIDTWDEFVADFKKQFYPENDKNEAKSQLCKLKKSGMPREYVKEFTTLVLEIPKLSNQDSLFYFLNGLQGWAKTEWGEKNAQPKVDHARKPPTEKDKNLKTSYKSGRCFICDGPYRARDCPKKASLNGMSTHEDEDASDGESMGSMRILIAIKVKTERRKRAEEVETLEWATEDANKGCEATRHVNLIELPNDNFPKHYFNFASYNELPARADGRNVILTGDAITNCINWRTIDIQNLSNALGYSTFRCKPRFGGVTDWYQSQGYREPAMSSASSAVTYTFVYTDFEPGRVFWGADEEISDGGSPRVIVYGYDGLPMQPPHDPDYVPEPIYPEYIPLEDEHVFPVEEQPLPHVDSPTAESPGYVAESNPKEDPEEYEDNEIEDGPVVYPMDGGDDGDDDDGDSSGGDADDEDEDEEEEDEHLTLADSAVIVPTVEPISPPEGTEPVIPPPSTYITTTGARITVRLQAFISLPLKAEVERLLAMTTPLPSPPISLSPPFAGERLARCTAPSAHSSPPPVPSPLLPSFGCPTQTQTLRIASTQTLIDAFTAALPSPPLPPSLYIPPPVDRMDDLPESELPPRKRLCLSTIGSSTMDAKARRQGISEVGYGIRDTWVDPAEAVPEIAPMTLGEVNTRVTELAELHEHDTHDLYALLEDAQEAHQETIQNVEVEAYASREAWAYAIRLSQAVHSELQTHREQVYAHESQLHAHQTQLQLQGTLLQTQHQVHETRFQMQQAEIAELRETDRRRQAQMAETLRVMRDMRREMVDMQAELLALREQRRRARQPGSDARAPDHQEASRDADSHI